MAKINPRDETLLWFARMKRRINECFLPLLFDRHRFLILKGGGGSGKSIFAGQLVLERANSEPGHRVLVARKVARTLKDSCYAQLCAQARELYGLDESAFSRNEIKFPNGSVILFAGLDDVEKLKSIYNITIIWVEEASEITEEDFNQLDIRLRTAFPYRLQMILTFNPVSITHWLKRRFFDKEDPRARVHESTYLDNRFLIDDAIRTLESFRETDEYYYMVYCLGMWGVTGKTIFPAAQVSERLTQCRKEKWVRRGLYEYTESPDGIHIADIRWVDDDNGPVTIYRAPVPGVPYVIGGDTAGEGSDWFIGQVLDNRSGEQVAVLRCQMDEDAYARQMYCLGREFGWALTATETNFSTYPTKILDKMGYPKLYVREVEDTFTGKIRHSYGFQTTKVTRPVILGELVKFVRGSLELIHDCDTLSEMLTFVRNEKLRPEAEAGAHDDCIMALAIAHYARGQQSSMLTKKEEPKSRKWTSDMWEDWEHASAAEREEMVALWGRPA